MTTVLERDDRADREIDAARDDHDRHADRGDADDRRLPRHQLQVVGAKNCGPTSAPKMTATSTRPRNVPPRSMSDPRRHATGPPLVAAIIRSCSVQRSGRYGLAQLSAVHDRDPIAQAEQLGKIAADHQDRFRRAPGRVGDELVDQPVDLRLAADVDAARRLVEQQHVDVVVEQPRDRDFLLVAAGELRRRTDPVRRT